MDEAFLIQEFDAPFLFFHDFPCFSRAVRKSPHVAEGYALRPEGSACTGQVFHGQLQRDLEIPMMRDAVGVFFRAVAIRVHVVPDKMADEGEAIAQPDDRFMQMIRVVGIDDRVDVGSDSHFRDVSQAFHQSGPSIGVRGDEVMNFGAIAVQRDVDMRQTRVDNFLEKCFVGQELTVGDHPGIQALLRCVFQRWLEQWRERGLPPSENDAVVVHFCEAIDDLLHFRYRQVHSSRGVAAKPTVLVAVAG